MLKIEGHISIAKLMSIIKKKKSQVLPPLAVIYLIRLDISQSLFAIKHTQKKSSIIYSTYIIIFTSSTAK